MPMYECKCSRCGEKFEAVRALNDSDNTVACPKCGEHKPKRLFSASCFIGTGVNKGNLRFPT
jgi:putative FmdB family regulatory protein